MKEPACEERALVDAHFAGTISAPDERTMRAHLDGCETCRARYRRQALLAKLDPEATTADVRLGRALGIEPAPAPATKPGAITSKTRENKPESKLRLLWPASGILALAASVLLLLRAPGDGGFVPRGAGDVDAKAQEAKEAGFVHVYRAPSPAGAATALVPVTDTIRKDDALAFAIENRDARPWVMIFGVNERGRVYWFYPAWNEERENPRALAIARDPALHELPDAITHHFEGTTLHVHALYLDDAMTVREIESLVGDGTKPLTIPRASDHVTTFSVAP